jgi:hypothetical protein
VLVALLLGAACSGGGGGSPAQPPRRASPRKDAAQADAELLGREVFEIVDRVMSYRSSHRGKLPASLRQAGLDSLAPLYVRRLGRQGSDPLVTIVFRNTTGHVLSDCRGSNAVLEDQALRGGSFDVTCTVIGGGPRRFTIPPREPPPK